MKDGSVVELENRGKEIIIKPVHGNKLSEMLSQINEDNIHEEIDWGKPVGNEIW